MLARWSRSFAKWSPLRRFACGPCEVASSRAPAGRRSTDISGLLLLQRKLRGDEVGQREGRKHERIHPKIGKPQSFGESADADRLKPGRRKHQAYDPPLTGERGHRHQQTKKVGRWDYRKNGGRENRRDLRLGERRDELAEPGRREHIEQRSEH